MVRTAPVLILEGASYATAKGARLALERLGATIEVRAYEVETPRPQEPSATNGGWPIPLVILFVVILILFILIILAKIMVANLGDPTF